MSRGPASTPIEWHPAQLLKDGRQAKEFALIILNQPLNDISTLTKLWQNYGGANRLYDIYQQARVGDNGDKSVTYNNLDIIIGDLDSLDRVTRAHYEKVNPSIKIILDEDQYSTDFTKAVRHIRASASAPDIVAMGGLGGRVDQGLSQIHHLYMFQTSTTYADGKMYLVSGESLTFLLKAGKHVIHVRESVPGQDPGVESEDVFDKYAGIIPVKEPSVISLKGFEWDVEDWPTEFGGQISTSNHVLPESKAVEVTTSRDVLFTVALKGRGEKE